MSGVSGFESALHDLARVFEKNEVPYMVIGGLANAVWGYPRATLDIDVTVWAPEERIRSIITALEKEFVSLVDDPLDFVKSTRVFPVKTKEKQRIDVIFGVLPFEKEAIASAVDVTIGGTTVKFCTAENLILMKIISDRPKDSEDVRGILKYRKETLDYEYLEPRIIELSGLLDNPGMLEQWEKWKADEEST